MRTYFVISTLMISSFCTHYITAKSRLYRASRATIYTVWDCLPSLGAISYSTYLAHKKINGNYSQPWWWLLVYGIGMGGGTAIVAKEIIKESIIPLATKDMIDHWCMHYQKP